jgi:SAM-dependent methyltransferase
MGRAAGGTDASLSQFHGLAKYYDALNEWKDYARETRQLERLARRFGRPGRTSWLDVACGTGRHLEFLRRGHPVVGVDGSREMLGFARRRLPGVRLVLGDMRAFHLHRQFDVVTCLFSAIGHLQTKEEVRLTFANLARHLRPGGVMIVEPWISPAGFRAGYFHLRTFDGPTLKAARLAFSARRGNRSEIHYHFLVGEPGHGVRYFAETDSGILLSRGELLRLTKRAGLQARFLAQGLMPGRGLLIGVKPSRTAHPRELSRSIATSRLKR